MMMELGGWESGTVEGFFFEESGEAFSADFDFDGLMSLGESGGDVGEADPRLEGGRKGTAGGFGDLLITDKDGVVGAGRGAGADHFEGDEAALDSLGFLFGKGGATDKIGFREIHEKAQSRLEGGGLVIEIGAVEWVAHFEAEGIARAEATGFDGEGQAFLEDGVPSFDGDSGWAEDFESVFARVTGSGDVKRLIIDENGEDFVVSRGGVLVGEKGLEEGGGLGALDGEASEVIAVIFEGDRGIEVGEHPGEIFFDFRGIDHEEEAVFGDAVDDEIIDDATGGVEEESILALADEESVDIVGEEAVEPGGGLGAFGEKLAHVGDIEDAEILANGVMFVDDPGVLDGHGPATEVDHFGTESDVFSVEWSLFESGGMEHENGG